MKDMKNPLLIMMLLVILLAFNGESWPQTYKYVDEKGVTHFTNVPADPRYKRASKSIDRQSSKKPKDARTRSHSKSTTPQNIRK